MKTNRIGNYRVQTVKVGIYAAEDIMLNKEIIYRKGAFIKSTATERNALPFGKYIIKSERSTRIHLTTIGRQTKMIWIRAPTLKNRQKHTSLFMPKSV